MSENMMKNLAQKQTEELHSSTNILSRSLENAASGSRLNMKAPHVNHKHSREEVFCFFFLRVLITGMLRTV